MWDQYAASYVPRNARECRSSSCSWKPESESVPCLVLMWSASSLPRACICMAFPSHAEMPPFRRGSLVALTLSATTVCSTTIPMPFSSHMRAHYQRYIRFTNTTASIIMSPFCMCSYWLILFRRLYLLAAGRYACGANFFFCQEKYREMNRTREMNWLVCGAQLLRPFPGCIHHCTTSSRFKWLQ
jgi:hypothetical protein